MGRPRHRSIHRFGHHRHRHHLADSLKRHLLITRRRIPLDRIEEYARLWRAVRHQAAAAGANAWIFRARAVDDHFIEFIEWQSDEAHAIIDERAVSDALETLNAAFIAEDSQTWIEAKI